MSDIAERLGEITTEQRVALLERLLREKSRREPRRFALSFAQHRLWALTQMDGGSPAYNVPAALWARGALDVKAFERSFGEVIRRHESLRTTFELNEETGEPEQLIHPWEPFELEVLDLTSMPKAEREQAARRLANEEAQKPFDLSKGPLLRVRVLKIEADKHVLLLTLSHIVSDMWSTGILTSEVVTLYDSYSEGRESPLPGLPIQYADFAHWQRSQFASGKLERQMAYWRERLKGPLPALELPTRGPRPPLRSQRGAERVSRLDLEILDGLKKLSRREGVTLFMTLVAAFKALLYRYTGERDILVGTPVAGRNRREFESLIGIFINTLVLRTDLSGEPTFRELLSRVKEVSLGAFANQDAPFEKLVEELRPERDLSRSPFFQVMFALQNVPQQGAQTRHLSFTPFPLDLVSAKFDLTLPMLETEEGLLATWEYNTDLFDEAMIDQMIRHYKNILIGVIAHPDQSLSRIPLLDLAERAQALASSSSSPAPRPFAPCPPCLHYQFEAQVTSAPLAIALVCENAALSYFELNRRANRLAHLLRSRGVGPQTLVGLFIDRSLDLVIGLLAILKAGGAYLPLDPAYPPERLAFVLDDARVAVLLTESRMVGALPQSSAEVICLDSDRPLIDSQDDTDPPRVCAEDDPAYVIYTSGSTGKPKGVVVTHANVRRLFESTHAWFNFDHRDVWTLFHSYAFDFSVWEIWGALLYGGRLVIVPYFVSREPQAFYELLVEQGVTVLNQTPSAFRNLMAVDVRSARRRELELRTVIFGGEALELQSLRPWYEGRSDERPELVNMYGITETTVHVTYRPLRKGDTVEGRGSLIGKGIPDLRVYVLDEEKEPAPVGVAGEMYVGGAGVSRGYLSRPELTAERFIPDPYGEVGGERLYKTGDVARRTRDGDLEYMGRKDQQVKIRGFRIELGEVESALYEHRGVKEAVAVAREVGGEKQLVAYVVCDGEEPSATELRKMLKEKLPEHMAPGAIVRLERLPLTENGKLDRRALPDPAETRPELETPFVHPRNFVEEVLAEAWAEVLGLEQVGIDDNFFDLGGDSIRSIQVAAKTQKRGLRFSLQQLFERQTIRQLAERLTANDPGDDRAQPERPLSLISDEDRAKLPDDVEDAYPLTLLQTGMLFHSDYDFDAGMYHNVGTYHLKAPLDVKVFEEAVEQLLLRHAVLRASFDLANFSEPLQLVHRKAPTPLEVEDISHLSPDEQEESLARWKDSEMKRRFDWDRPPLLRFHIHRRGATSFQFSMIEHHAILDGWSVASAMTELFSLYFSMLNGEGDVPVAPVANLFCKFVSLERQALASEDCRRYWHEKLGDAAITTIPRLPSSYRESAPLQNHVVAVPISSEVSEGIRRLARSVSAPLKNALLAAHVKVMSFIGGQPDVVTGIVTHGRPEGPDGERVLGLFLNTLPLRLKIGGGSWEDLVREVFETERESMPYRYYPLAQIQRNKGGQPLFETVFNFTNFHVFEKLQSFEQLEILDANLHAETNFIFWANFSLDLRSNEIILTLNGDAGSLSKRQMEDIGGYYARTLEAMSHEPDSSVAAHNPLSVEERRQILVEWNNGKAERPREDAIYELFEAQAERAPDAIAIVCADRQITFRELNRRANQLARRLRSLGVGPEVRVGVCAERSVEMVIGLLGILKAGGAYVPLDPSYPKDRIAFMLEDTQAPLLLAHQHLVASLPGHRAEVICLDSDWGSISQEDWRNLPINVTADSLAYVIYTSGSTGMPKGVAIEHRSALSFLYWARTVFIPEDWAGVLASTSICFDLSIFEIFGPLSWGGKLFMVENALGLATPGEDMDVRMINTVPSAMAELARLKAIPKSVRTVNLAGEALQKKLVQQIYEEATIQRVFNLYGPSEDTTYSTFALMKKGNIEEPVIGRPIVNTQVYLLDARQHAVPIGVAGELQLGGEGLARGYLNRPEITAEKFVPDQFGGGRGARVYKTGDLARYLPDGNLEFLGRIDHQVKIRGFRIELGEIEAALGMHPAVRKAVVLAGNESSGDEGPGETRLVAYLAADQNSRDVGALRSFLKQRLPDYMTPSIFVWLDELPLTPNGKVDRRALQALEKPRSEAGAGAPPRDLLEFQLTQIWEGVLNRRPISVTDNFFDLGGHSLLAVRLLAQIKDKLKYNLPLSALVRAADIENLARLLRQQSSSQSESPVAPIQAGGSKRPFFCVHPIGGNVLCYIELARGLGSEQPFYGLQADSANEAGGPASIEDMARRYVEETRKIQSEGPYVLGGWSFGGVVAYEMARQLQEQGQKVGRLVLLDSWAPSSSGNPASALREDDSAELMARFLLDIGGISGKDVPIDFDDVRRLDADERLKFILEQAMKFKILPPDMELSRLNDLFVIFKRHVRAIRNYAPRPLTADARVILFRAGEGKDEILDGPALGWDGLLADKLAILDVPGNHYSMLYKPHVQTLAHQVNACLNIAA